MQSVVKIWSDFIRRHFIHILVYRSWRSLLRRSSERWNTSLRRIWLPLAGASLFSNRSVLESFIKFHDLLLQVDQDPLLYAPFKRRYISWVPVHLKKEMKISAALGLSMPWNSHSFLCCFVATRLQRNQVPNNCHVFAEYRQRIDSWGEDCWAWDQGSRRLYSEFKE